MKFCCDHAFIHLYCTCHLCHIFTRYTVCFSNHFKHPDKIKDPGQTRNLFDSYEQTKESRLGEKKIGQCHSSFWPGEEYYSNAWNVWRIHLRVGTKRTKNSLTKNVFTGSKHELVFTRNALTSSCLYKTETSLGELLVLIEHWVRNALGVLIL